VPRGQILPFNFDEYFHKCCRATSIVGATAEHNQQSTRMALDLIAAGKTPAELFATNAKKMSITSNEHSPIANGR
jgi:hypothetical protein